MYKQAAASQVGAMGNSEKIKLGYDCDCCITWAACSRADTASSKASADNSSKCVWSPVSDAPPAPVRRERSNLGSRTLAAVCEATVSCKKVELRFQSERSEENVFAHPEAPIEIGQHFAALRDCSLLLGCS